MFPTYNSLADFSESNGFAKLPTGKLRITERTIVGHTQALNKSDTFLNRSSPANSPPLLDYWKMDTIWQIYIFLSQNISEMSSHSKDFLIARMA